MATLAGNTIASTYPLLLKIDSSGIDGTLRVVEDGDATDSALLIATNKVEVKPGSNDANAFEVSQADGTAVFTVNSSTPSATLAGTLTATKSLSSDTQTTPETILTLGATYANTGTDGGAGSGSRIEFQIPDDETNPITGAAIAGIKEAADDSDASAGMAFYVSQNDTTLDEVVRIDHDGKVGIGTSSPGATIHTAHSSSTAYNGGAEILESAIIQNTNGSDGSGVNNVASLGLQVASGATSQGFINYVRTGDNTGDFTISQRTGSSSYAEHMRITSGGFVGINRDSNVHERLTVSGMICSLGSSSTSSTAGNQRAIMDLTSNGARLGHFRGTNGAGSGSCKFFVDSTEMVEISDEGHLGIGCTPSASYNLHIEDSVSPVIAVQDTTNNVIAFMKSDNDSTEFGSLSNHAMDLRVNNTAVLTIDTSYNVGIGDASPDAHFEVSNETVNPNGSSFTGMFSNHIITTGSYDSSDSFFGIRNHLEANQSGMGFGSMYGVYNNNQCTLAAGEMTQLTGISNTNTMEAGDVNYMRGILNFNNFDGGTIDNNIVTLYNLTEIASGGTISGSVYAIENDHDADTNPSGEMLGYYGIARSNADYHMKLYSATQSSLVMRWHDNGAMDHENGLSSNASLDYAEYFESKDGKAIAIGTTVKLDDGKIVACEEGDTPIGVVRPLNTSAVVGGSQAFHWQGMYETDDYGGYVMESFSWTKWEKEVDYDTYKSVTIGDGGVLGGTVKKESYEKQDGSKKYEIIYRFHTDRIPSDLTVPSDARVIEDKNKRKKINSDYDHSKADSYKGREERDEWHIVGLLGQIQITKGQPVASNWIKMKDVSDTVELYFVK